VLWGVLGAGRGPFLVEILVPTRRPRPIGARKSSQLSKFNVFRKLFLFGLGSVVGVLGVSVLAEFGPTKNHKKWKNPFLKTNTKYKYLSQMGPLCSLLCVYNDLVGAKFGGGCRNILLWWRVFNRTG
jgi:hypothetical protein